MSTSADDIHNFRKSDLKNNIKKQHLHLLPVVAGQQEWPWPDRRVRKEELFGANAR